MRYISFLKVRFEASQQLKASQLNKGGRVDLLLLSCLYSHAYIAYTNTHIHTHTHTHTNTESCTHRVPRLSDALFERLCPGYSWLTSPDFPNISPVTRPGSTTTETRNNLVNKSEPINLEIFSSVKKSVLSVLRSHQFAESLNAVLQGRLRNY